MRRSAVVLLLALMLLLTPLVSLADSSIAQPTFTPTEVERECSIKALTPLTIEAPDFCGVGRWLPERLYLRMYADAARGLDCERDIRSKIASAVAAMSVQLDRERQQKVLYRAEAERLKAISHPPILWRMFRVGMGTLAGAGAGLVGGGVMVGSGDASLERGLVSGVAIGAGVGLIAGLVVELL